MTSPSSIRVLLVDDHFVVRSGLVASLELEDDLEIVGEADSGEDALTAYPGAKPDLVLMDLQLVGIDGIETTRRLIADDADARVLVFSTFARDDEILAALDAGAAGYLQKSAARGELVGAIRSVASGEPFLPEDIAKRIDALRLETPPSEREREILQLVAKGRANKEIASALGISEDTVKRHVSNVLRKLGTTDRAGATAEAIRRGIVKVES